ncbi:hypothetical protein [Desulfitobacterium chlororespirans]|uniref:Uncharacterized protein n=1 Tax=Desulfitobacterium chlororespirans DSM 11544 TaxID=1121395 RepID=A0A1M7SNT6_9FIRM|nr:hypothetical protein [Desulfitobacterium chlororespirans]SHN60110.1 hypothetical protein SAMN02745215_01131 [Desulfitobacterium chlororespirans DSM 11544]
MSKYATRIPSHVGKGALPDHPAIKTPWEKLISFHDAYHYACRHIAVMDQAFFNVLRIVIPDYEKRCKALCDANYNNIYRVMSSPYGKIHAENHSIHPFMAGGFLASMYGDSGDERLCMPGRLNDFGQYRCEKELDECPWDILGSEICRASTHVLDGIGAAFGGHQLDYHMVEAKGCGDLHCRIVAESREKYPMPEHDTWEKFGPIATADQIKYTPEDQMLKEPQQFRAECDYKYRNGLNMEMTAAEQYPGVMHPLGADYVMNTLNPMIAANEITQEQVAFIVECVFNAAGKMAFGEFFAIKGLRDWLGVPNDVDGARVLGGYIEVMLQVLRVPYTVAAFDENEAVYDITLANLERRHPMLTHAYLSMWYGMCKTLIGSQWFAWRETEGVPGDILQLRISKKIDKFCL